MVEFGAVCHLCHGNCKIRIGNTQKIGDGMTIFNFISLFGGLALFLYGMQLMGDGLKKGSSGALKAAMEKVTNNPLVGFLLGLAYQDQLVNAIYTGIKTYLGDELPQSESS